MGDDRHESHRHSVATTASRAKADSLPAMNALFLAAEAHLVDPPGDDHALLAYTLLGFVMVVTAIVTWIVTPKGEVHHH